jgi:hypothetical protein
MMEMKKITLANPFKVFSEAVIEKVDGMQEQELRSHLNFLINTRDSGTFLSEEAAHEVSYAILVVRQKLFKLAEEK